MGLCRTWPIEGIGMESQTLQRGLVTAAGKGRGCGCWWLGCLHKHCLPGKNECDPQHPAAATETLTRAPSSLLTSKAIGTGLLLCEGSL